METKQFFSTEDNAVLEKVKEAFKQGFQVEWITQYETFYGVGWANWVRNNLTDVTCEIKCTGYNPWYHYCDRLLITSKTA